MPEETVTTVTTETAPVKFGIGQIGNPTPKVAKNIFRIMLYAAAVANLLLQVVVEIPPHVAGIIGKYSLYAVTLAHGFSKLFGIDVSEIPTTFQLTGKSSNQKSSI
jgi:hypothetical protein